MTEHGTRESTERWRWAGPPHVVTGRSWGGNIEVLQWLLAAGRFTSDLAVLEGAVLLLESSEELIPAREFGWILRSLGERGVLEAVAAVVVARPPTSNVEQTPSEQERSARRTAQAATAMDLVGRYNPGAVVVVGVPFGHTRPQWILPYGGDITVDGDNRTLVGLVRLSRPDPLRVAASPPGVGSGRGRRWRWRWPGATSSSAAKV